MANSAATPSQHPVRLPSPQAVLRRLRARLHIFGDADGGGCLPGDDRFRIDDKKGFDLKSASCELSCQAYRWRDQKKSADLFGDIHLTAGPVHYTLVSNFATYHVDKHLLEMHGLVRVVAAGKGAAAPNVRTGDTGLVHVDRPSGPQIIVR